eukprot:m.231140 g.231140  ORF g.231140 m.231140 type:complete len:455 (+) comp18253_c0_seq1:13-1377(+)
MESQPLLTHVQQGKGGFHLYGRRWGMLLIIVLLQISNAMIWINFSPIEEKTKAYYNVDDLTVDFLSLVYMMASVVLGPLASWMIDTQGLRRSVLFAAILNAAGGWLRYAGDFTGGGKIPLLFLGQTLAACAQPVILDSPTPLAAIWFGENERATANMIASVANPLGVALGSFFPPMIVSEPSDLRQLYLYFSLPASLGLVLVAAVFRDRPPTPPSASAESEGHESFMAGVRSVLHNRAYLLLLLAFGIGVGMFSSLTTLLGQIVNAQGYSDDDAGIFGASLIGVGLVGAVISAVVADRTRRFTEIVRVCFPGATLGILMLTLVNKPDNYGLVLTACGISGFFTFAALPVSLELCVECTYPVQAGTSAGLLWMAGQVFGIIFIFAMNALQGSDNRFENGSILNITTNITTTTYDTYADMSNSCWVAVAGGALGSLCLMFFRTEYKRMKAEQKAAM